MKYKSVMVSTLALALLACGGDDSSSAPPSGGGTATPSPSPTPTPTPTPTPSVSTYSELTGEQAFDMTCGALNISNSANGFDLTRATTPFGDEVALQSNRDEPNYTITTLGNLLPAGSIFFDQTDRDLNNMSSEAYFRETASGGPQFLDIDTPTIDGQPAAYMRSLRSAFQVTENNNLQLRCAFGVATPLTDVPDAPIEKSIADFFLITTATINGETATFDFDPSVISFAFDPDNGEVRIDINLRGQEILDGGALSPDVIDFGDIVATGSFDGETTNFGGTITTLGGAQIGDFAGWLFGPQGTEAAIAIRIDPSADLPLRARGAIFLR